MSSSPLMFDILPSSRRQMEMEEGRGGHHQQHQPRNHQQHHAIILNSFEEDEIEDLTVAHRRLTANSNRYPNSPSVGEGGQMLMTAATPSTSSIAATPVVGNGRGNNNSNANNGSRGEPFEAMTLSQVNISGLRAATDESRQRGRRLVWVLLLTICFAVMVAQITDRVRHFLSEPVSVQVSVTRNASLAYPAISICNKVKKEAYITKNPLSSLELVADGRMGTTPKGSNIYPFSFRNDDTLLWNAILAIQPPIMWEKWKVTFGILKKETPRIHTFIGTSPSSLYLAFSPLKVVYISW